MRHFPPPRLAPLKRGHREHPTTGDRIADLILTLTEDERIRYHQLHAAAGEQGIISQPVPPLGRIDLSAIAAGLVRLLPAGALQIVDWPGAILVAPLAVENPAANSVENLCESPPYNPPLQLELFPQVPVKPLQREEGDPNPRRLGTNPRRLATNPRSRSG